MTTGKVPSTPSASVAAARRQFQALHEPGGSCFVLPNPWDVGSARILEHLGFVALATTSSGFAASLGRPDMSVELPELVAHVEAVTAAIAIPLNVDAERCFGDTPEEVAASVELLAEAGASGISIEDWNPATGAIDPLPVAVERVRAASEACARHGVVLTGRAENLLHGVDDLDDTIERLCAYRDAGAGCLYAPGLARSADIARVVEATGRPVNVLSLAGVPTVPELAALGVRRVSTGGALAWAAYGALVEAARELQGPGTNGFRARAIPADVRAGALRADRTA